MVDKTKIIVDKKLKEYLKTYNIKLTDEEYNKLYTDYRGLLESTEFLKNTKEDKQKFKNEYSYRYERILKTIYKAQMRNCSNVNVLLEEPEVNFYIGSIDSNRSIFLSMKEALSNLDYLLAYSTKIVNNAVENDDKIEIDYKDCALGGEEPETIMENLNDYFSNLSLKNDYLNNKNPDTTMLEDGLALLEDAQKLATSNKKITTLPAYAMEKGKYSFDSEMALGELQLKAATIYVLMREEHRSHNFLWRWFKGGDSRDRLKQFKERYCQVFNIRKKNATNNMLNLAKGNSLLQRNHENFCDECLGQNFFKEIKASVNNGNKENEINTDLNSNNSTYKEIIETKIKDDFDFGNKLEKVNLDDELLPTDGGYEQPFESDINFINKTNALDDDKDIEPFILEEDEELNRINQKENEKHEDFDKKIDEGNKLPDLPF